MHEISYYDSVNGFKEQKKHTIQWLLGVPLCDKKDSSTVNLVILTIQKAKNIKVEVLSEEKSGKKRKNFTQNK